MDEGVKLEGAPLEVPTVLDLTIIPEGSLVFIRVAGDPDDFVKHVFDQDTVLNELKSRKISALILDKSCDISIMTDEDLAKCGLMRINAANQ